MYIPSSFAVDDPKTLHAFVDSYPFATLLSPGEEPEVTHLPLLLDVVLFPLTIIEWFLRWTITSR